MSRNVLKLSIACLACHFMTMANSNPARSQPPRNDSRIPPASAGLPPQRPPVRTDTPNSRSANAGDKIDQFLTRIALENIPRDFSDTKKWGGQAERWDGLKVERDGLKIETHRRKKMVNHGTWKKYSASLRNPTEEFQIQIKNIHEATNGKLAMEIHVAAHLNIEGRQAKWVKGVQIYSVNATGHAFVRAQIDMELGVQMGVAKFPPDLVFTPQATAAQLTIEEFRIDRVSKIGGEFAQQISNEVHEKLTEKIGDHEKKLVEKINQQLNKKQDDFRLSFADAMKSKWSESLSGVLPDQLPAP